MPPLRTGPLILYHIPWSQKLGLKSYFYSRQKGYTHDTNYPSTPPHRNYNPWRAPQRVPSYPPLPFVVSCLHHAPAPRSHFRLLSCQLHEHGVVEELVDAHVLAQPFSAPGLHLRITYTSLVKHTQSSSIAQKEFGRRETSYYLFCLLKDKSSTQSL